MNNYPFDLNEWMARCPLQERSYGGFDVEHLITGPCDLCNNEHLRRELRDRFKWGAPVPMDVFVMAYGEPEDRHVTKIGGLPYRPSDASWPRVGDGTDMLSLETVVRHDSDAPLTFIGQVNFNDSKDITGELPGDILLIFADRNYYSVYLEWQRAGVADLMRPEGIPRSRYAIEPCFGYLCRTASYPEALSDGAAWSDEIAYRGGRLRARPYLFRYQATQIGRAPHYVQDFLEDEPYRPLCAISSVQPTTNKAYPWVNQREAWSFEPEPTPWDPVAAEQLGQWTSTDDPEVVNYNHEPEESSDFLMIGDLGCLYIFMDDDGNLLWADACS